MVDVLPVNERGEIKLAYSSVLGLERGSQRYLEMGEFQMIEDRRS